jgi:hypothetical protein
MYDQKSSLFIVIREVTHKECPWLPETLTAGSVIYGREDEWCVCSHTGQAISFTPAGCYYEVPKNALRKLGIPSFSNN